MVKRLNTPYIPDKGDIVWIDSDHEQRDHRPALVISCKTANLKSGVAICLPITSQVKGLKFEIPLLSKKIKGVVLPNHIKSIDCKSEERRFKFIEKASEDVVDKCLEMLLMIFDAI